MARFPTFRHVHTSSRFDRSAESLERDLDGWMKQSNLITVTEVNSDRRAAQLREKGWDYYNAKRGGGADNAGIAWDRSVWRSSYRASRKLHQHRYIWENRQSLSTVYMHAATVMLVHQDSGHKLLVSVTHMVSGVDAVGQGFRHSPGWQSRKQAYVESNRNWSRWIDALDRTKNPDGIMIIADWNIDLKDNWFREFLRDHWGKNFNQTWKHFPSEGGSIGPGRGRIIDATLAKGLKIVDGAELLPITGSSDHRPYAERLQFKSPAEKAQDDRRDPDRAEGDTKPGRAWWGFGDYSGDEEYELNRETGEAGGEVLG